MAERAGFRHVSDRSGLPGWHLIGVSLAGTGAGTITGGLEASSGGDTNDASGRAGGDLTINPAAATLGFGNLATSYSSLEEGLGWTVLSDRASVTGCGAVLAGDELCVLRTDFGSRFVVKKWQIDQASSAGHDGRLVE